MFMISLPCHVFAGFDVAWMARLLAAPSRLPHRSLNYFEAWPMPIVHHSPPTLHFLTHFLLSKRNKMEGQHAAPIPRPRRSKPLPTKHPTPVKGKKSISVAAVFKRQPEGNKDVLQMARPAKNARKFLGKDALIEEMRSFHSISSSRSPRKAVNKVSKEKLEMHPLAAAYMSTSKITTDCADSKS
jgi:hypothetical protein